MYEFFKIVHIISVISWMAGLLYLPRLFVYHVERGDDSSLDETFQLMEARLFRFIMSPAMMVTFLSGLGLIYMSGSYFDFWFLLKFLCVFLLLVSHVFFKKCMKSFENGTNELSSKQYRLMNEIPTVLMIVIVTLVVWKPVI